MCQKGDTTLLSIPWFLREDAGSIDASLLGEETGTMPVISDPRVNETILHRRHCECIQIIV